MRWKVRVLPVVSWLSSPSLLCGVISLTACHTHSSPTPLASAESASAVEARANNSGAPPTPASAEPSPSVPASAAVSAASSPSTRAEPDAGVAPELPAPELSGPAAIVWVPDAKAEHQFRSVWIERDGSAAKFVAERKELVIVGKSELFRFTERPKRVKTQACNDPNSQCTKHPLISEPYLKSLATGKARAIPWSDEFAPSEDCDRNIEVSYDGAVGSVVFMGLFVYDFACGGSCPAHTEKFITFDVDTGAVVNVEFPPAVVEPLRARAKGKLEPGDPDWCGTLPMYRAAGAYNSRGELEGSYEFGESHDGMCGGAPGCQRVTERSPVVPSALQRWRKLPGWVGAYLASAKADYAFIVPEVQFAAAKAQFAK
jgi:hypothetical protein